MKTTPDEWVARIGHVESATGGFFPGVGARVRGKPLHHHCRERRWFDLYLFALTGRQFAPNEIELLETLWTYTSYPDPRIWNNRVAALAGSSRASAGLAIGAAVAVSDAEIYGMGPGLASYDFLARYVDATDDDLQDAIATTLKRDRRLGGYGRPVVSDDERIAPTIARARALDLADGPHVRTALRIERHLLEGRWRMRMNYAAIVSALCLDLGLTRDEYACFTTTIFLGGMPPVWKAARQDVAGGLFPIPTSQVHYDGHEPRSWPR
ncbi:citryl-CoA lyase [Nitrogeniibacter mangrovi]|uniref:Citryl-CoA lyase n=1 Tax=Nitrogeniibacter mangrovi TaxID=2016596 RepID=A0A6C1B0X2_9RHOO|nr:citryl-CoA lyase [Nitrogeniibacter mangrovi]QID16478.1 citryl-CoA lyase [Nitrogeniibacter mangrovi]